jgi:hypothetical protein
MGFTGSHSSCDVLFGRSRNPVRGGKSETEIPGGSGVACIRSRIQGPFNRYIHSVCLRSPYTVHTVHRDLSVE